MHSRLIALTDELGISSTLLASRGFRECHEAKCLEVAETGVNGREHFLIANAADAWQRLKAEALHEGVTIFIVSAFRSIERQAEIVRRKLDSDVSIDEILTVCAPPGFSEHHTGRAIDISTPDTPSLEVEFDQTQAFAWLKEHANDFGFHMTYAIDNIHGYQYEPWHWCFKDT